MLGPLITHTHPTLQQSSSIVTGSIVQLSETYFVLGSAIQAWSSVVGLPDGTSDGEALGVSEGTSEGDVDGTEDGAALGVDEGTLDGVALGAADGDVDGFSTQLFPGSSFVHVPIMLPAGPTHLQPFPPAIVLQQLGFIILHISPLNGMPLSRQV